MTNPDATPTPPAAPGESGRRLLAGTAVALLLAGAALLAYDEFSCRRPLAGHGPVTGDPDLAVAAALTGLLGAVLLLAAQLAGRLGRGLAALPPELSSAKASRTESDLRMRALVESAPEAIVIFDADTRRFSTVNPKAEELFGLPRARMLQIGLAEVSPPTQPDGRPSELLATERIQEALDGGTPTYESTLLRSDGRGIPCELRLVRLPGGNGRQIRGSIADISARKELDRLKEEFVSTVSHELRTPLTSIEASLALLESGLAGALAPSARPLVEIARKNCRRLTNLINDILDSEMIAAGRMRFSFKRLDLRALVEEAVEGNKAYAGRLDVRIVLGEAVAGAVVEGDPDRLMQVLSNLISNACKYSPRGDVVAVTLEPRFGGWRIGVRDHGPGIPASFRSRIFQRFSQADGSDIRPQGGTGLGLSISKTIVEKHQGRLGFESEPGKGSLFFIDLPPWTPPRAGGAPPACLLVCEDDPSVSALLRTLLEREGFETECVATAAAAREALERRDFDVLTLDLLLPDHDGIAFLRELRGRERTSSLPVVVVSADVDEKAPALADPFLDVVDCIEKPIPVRRLLAAVRRALHRNDAKARILHVESAPDVRAVAALALRDAAELVGVSTLAEARRELQERRFDLIVAGIPLPAGIAQVPVVRFEAPAAPSRVAEALLETLAAHPELPAPLRSLFSTAPLSVAGP